MGGTLHPRLNMWTISNTPTCTLSQFYDWLIRRNVSMIDSWDCCYHFLLVERVRRQHSLVAKTQYCAVLVSRGGWYQSPSSCPSNHLLYRGSCAACGHECPLICCVMDLLTAAAEPAVMHVISADTAVADMMIWFDTIHPVLVPIRYRSNNRPLKMIIKSVNSLMNLYIYFKMLFRFLL